MRHFRCGTYARWAVPAMLLIAFVLPAIGPKMPSEAKSPSIVVSAPASKPVDPFEEIKLMSPKQMKRAAETALTMPRGCIGTDQYDRHCVYAPLRQQLVVTGER